MIVFVCDKCRREEKKNINSYYQVRISNIDEATTEYQLCPSCTQELYQIVEYNLKVDLVSASVK